MGYDDACTCQLIFFFFIFLSLQFMQGLSLAKMHDLTTQLVLTPEEKEPQDVPVLKK